MDRPPSPLPLSSRHWLHTLSLEDLRVRLGSDAIARALMRPPERVGDVRLTARGEANARFSVPPDGYYTYQTGRQVETIVGQDASGLIIGRCTCHTRSPCQHVVSLVVDLALSEPLRVALLSHEPTEPAQQDLARLRAGALAPLRLDLKVETWIEAGAGPVEMSHPEIYLRVPEPADRTPWALRMREEAMRDTTGVSCFELRLRMPGKRPYLALTDLAKVRIEPALQRVLRMCAVLRSAPKAFFASGRDASVVLDQLRGMTVLNEVDRTPIGFGEVPLRIAVERATMARSALATSDADEEESVAYRPRAARQIDLFADDGVLADALPPTGPIDVMQAQWQSPDETVAVPVRETQYFGGPYPFVWHPALRIFHPVDRTLEPDFIERLVAHPIVRIHDDAQQLYARLRPGLRARRVRLPPAEAFGLPSVERPKLSVRVEGSPLEPRVTLEAAYGHGAFAVDRATLDALVPGAIPARDEDTERDALARIEGAGLVYDPTERAFTAHDMEPARFWTEVIASLRSAVHPEWTLLVAEALRNVRVRAPVRSRVRVALVGDWLESHVHFDVEDLEADMARVCSALAGGRRWVVLDDGTLSRISDEIAELVEDVSETLGPRASGRLAPHQLGRIERWIENAATVEVDPAVRALRSRLRALAVSAEPELPRHFETVLRPYQLRGLAWLQFLDELGAGGVLADDMGLGKTVMALALLQWRRERDGVAPSLVVCPTSVMGNWLHEAQRFAPDLRVMLYHGAERHAALANVREFDLVVTTYAVLRRDIEALSAIPFRYGILDEAQNVKNVETATTQAATRLHTHRRLALSGTPVENRLSELWSLLEFCNPTMLGSHRAFEKRYERPIAQAPFGSAAVALRALVRPFVLRRTKREVLLDLPPKEEIDRTCVPGSAQRRLYDTAALVAREEVGKAIQAQGLARSGLSILTALLRLRQIACDPRLVDDTVPADASCKRNEFLELVRGLQEEGRRALVFSQFVQLLKLWRADLDALGIAYEYLDGSTVHRDDVVARFQSGTAPLFLISLKAGGTGLNLTAADTVIHCDPWWNPAVEDQATDRTHRIGQTRAVTVYRLIAQGTIEDKIVHLKARKRELADAVIHADAGTLQGLSEDDVTALLGGFEGEEADPDEIPPGEAAVPRAPRKPRG